MWWHSRGLFLSNFVLLTYICTQNLWKDKGWSSLGTSFGKTKHTSKRGLLFILKFPEIVKTVELRYNIGPRDWRNLFAVTRLRYVAALFSYISLLPDQRRSCVIPRTSLCRGFLYRLSTVFYFMSRLTLYESLLNFCIQR